MTVEEEKKLKEKILLETRKSVEVVRDPTLQGFLDRVGCSLVAQASQTPFEFNFNLAKDQDPNAFYYAYYYAYPFHFYYDGGYYRY